MSITIKTLKLENVEDDAGNTVPVMTVQYQNRIETFPGVFETLHSPVQEISPDNKEVFDQVLGQANTELTLKANQARAEADAARAKADEAGAAVESLGAQLQTANNLVFDLQSRQSEQETVNQALTAERDDLAIQLADANQAHQSLLQQHQTEVSDMQARIDDMQRSTLEANEDASRTRSENAQLRIKIQTALNALQPYPDAHAALVAELASMGIASDAPADLEV